MKPTLYRLTPEMFDVAPTRPLAGVACRPHEVLVVVTDQALIEGGANSESDRELIATRVNRGLGCHMLFLNDGDNSIFGSNMEAGRLLVHPNTASARFISCIHMAMASLEPIKHLVLLASVNEIASYGDFILERVQDELEIPVSFAVSEETQGSLYCSPARYLTLRPADQIVTTSDTSRLMRGIEWIHPRLVLVSLQDYAKSIAILWYRASRH